MRRIDTWLDIQKYMYEAQTVSLPVPEASNIEVWAKIPSQRAVSQGWRRRRFLKIKRFN